MTDHDDKKIMDWMDRLDPEELKGLEDIDPSVGEGPGKAEWAGIKKRTFKEIKKSSLRMPPRKWWALAGAAAILGIALLTLSPDVRADLKKMLQFIPGFGFVQQKDDSAQEPYVLEKTIEVQGEQGKLTVDGVLIESTSGQITLRGEHISDPTIKTLTLITNQGEYEFKQGSASSGGGSSFAWYSFNGTIPSNELDQVKLRFGSLTIGPMHLVQAKHADNLQDFGPSDTQNDVGITAVVTAMDGNRRKVNLLTQLPGQQILDSYSKEPITLGQQLQLTDSKGKTIEIAKDTGFVRPGEVLYDDPSGGAEQYQLTIPYVRISDPRAQLVKVTLPVPMEGIQDIQVSANLSGFPIDFTKVERLDDKRVLVHVNVHFDASAPRTLQNFRLFVNDQGRGMSYSWQVTEDTRAVELVWLDVEPGQKEMTYYIGEPQIVVKGPWVLRDLH